MIYIDSVKRSNLAKQQVLGENKPLFVQKLTVHAYGLPVFIKKFNFICVEMPRSCVGVGCSTHNMIGKRGLTFHIFPDHETLMRALGRLVEDMFTLEIEL